MNIVWTDDKCNELKTLWADGFSASQCGLRLGCSSNAVIGKVFRLGLPSRKPQFTTRPTRLYKKRAPRLAPEAVLTEKQLQQAEIVEMLLKDPDTMRAPESTVPAVAFANLDNDHCRWPNGDPIHDDSFCGCKVLKVPEGSGLHIFPYCAFHCSIAYAWKPGMRYYTKIGKAFTEAAGSQKDHAHV